MDCNARCTFSSSRSSTTAQPSSAVPGHQTSGQVRLPSAPASFRSSLPAAPRRRPAPVLSLSRLCSDLVVSDDAAAAVRPPARAVNARAASMPAQRRTGVRASASGPTRVPRLEATTSHALAAPARASSRSSAQFLRGLASRALTRPADRTRRPSSTNTRTRLDTVRRSATAAGERPATAAARGTWIVVGRFAMYDESVRTPYARPLPWAILWASRPSKTVDESR